MSEVTPEVAETNGSGDGAKAAPAKVARKTRAKAKPVPPAYFAGSVPGRDDPLDHAFGEICARIEVASGMPVWLLVHNTYDNEPLSQLSPEVRDHFFRARRQLADCDKALLIVDSPGGFARCAYEIASLFQRHCGGFTSAVPRYAKSAGTLLILGSEIIMSDDAEIGPLDAQIWDFEREEQSSALNEVQALERLHAQAVTEVDEMVPLLVGRTNKKIETITPMVLDFVAKMKRPLLEKIDTVHYTQQSRTLKEAEDYAIRLLRRSGLYEGQNQVRNAASRLVNRYSDHGFVIDKEEASEFLRVVEPQSGEVTDALSELADYLTDNTVLAIGRLHVQTTP
ncbi:MAG TPA: hypothetical protein VGH79_12945 [Gaiellaceae bacterium]|jgi:hypothetical protein